MVSKFKNFQEFYGFYLLEHSKRQTRALHLIGVLAAIGWLPLSALVFQDSRWMWVSLVIGYGFAWVAHFFVERNRPATFKYPLYSLMGDFRMVFDILRYRSLQDFGPRQRESKTKSPAEFK